MIWGLDRPIPTHIHTRHLSIPSPCIHTRLTHLHPHSNPHPRGSNPRQKSGCAPPAPAPADARLNCVLCLSLSLFEAVSQFIGTRTPPGGVGGYVTALYARMNINIRIRIRKHELVVSHRESGRKGFRCGHGVVFGTVGMEEMGDWLYVCCARKRDGMGWCRLLAWTSRILTISLGSGGLFRPFLSG